MNAGLRAAAERYRKLGTESAIITDHTGNPTGFVRVPGGRWDEVTDLADAYLAEHPADDADDITEDWLREIGFTYDDEWGATYIYGYKTFPLWYEDLCGEWGWGEAELPTPKTRGEVRRLMAALGIEAR